MRRILTIGLAAILGILLGSALETARRSTAGPMLGEWRGSSTPAVSAPPVDFSTAGDIHHAADVEVEGQRFRVYVGRTDREGDAVPATIWSFAVPVVGE
jgi:hypothetical protein